MAINEANSGSESTERVLNNSFDKEFQTLVFQPLGFNGIGITRMNSDQMSIQLDFDGGSNPVYIGLSAPGALSSEPKWQIRKITYYNDNPVQIQYANGSGNFDQIYDDRVGLTYV